MVVGNFKRISNLFEKYKLYADRSNCMSAAVEFECAVKPKILLLDDDPEVLDLYQEMLLGLSSEPEVHISTSGARAMSILESGQFNVLICDLKMPKMDGLQVISIVRRKYPQLRTVVLTGVADEQMRSRAYSLGIDLYLEKPANKSELTFLLDCIESLLSKETNGGFRGVQSKSMVDLIQLECLSGSSSVLKITNGRLEGKIWIQNGDLIDAATQEGEGEEAFKRILSWKTGTFEILPIESERERKIFTSYQGLLLDTAQALDEAEAETELLEKTATEPSLEGSDPARSLKQATLESVPGVEYAMRIPYKGSKVQVWGLENGEAIAGWIKETTAHFQKLGDKFHFGEVQRLEAKGLRRVLHIAYHGGDKYAVGIIGSPTRDEIDASVQKVLEQWAS
jgi:CheY-like chemotaxis protein